MKINILFVLSLLVIASCNKVPPANQINYKEQHRPQFHFSPEKGWMNDPNGLVYFKNTYHLFYQYFPDSTVWGPMHWGHAVSKDLVHWKHLPIALYPDSLGYIFSGSVVADKNNASGFQNGNDGPLVAIFTYHDMKKEKVGRIDRESQAIAYSNDEGNSWTKYTGNPVIKNKGDQDFRDPKVFWHEASSRWIMPLAVHDHLEIYSSPNLISWVKESEFGSADGAHGGAWECPDLFPLKTNEGIEKWVLIQNIDRGSISGGSGTQYFVGDFNGKTFVNENSPKTILWIDYGADNYAGVTWFGIPDSRRIFIGWMSNWDDYATRVPTKNWRSAMTIPRELGLIKTDEGLRITQRPIKELAQLWEKKIDISAQAFKDSLVIPNQSIQKEIELQFDLSQSTASTFGVIIGNKIKEKVIIGYDKAKHEVFIDRTKSGKIDFSKKFARKHTAPYRAANLLKLHLFIDAASVELFVDEGQIVMTEIFFPNEDFSNLTLFSSGGSSSLLKGELYELKSIWAMQNQGTN